MEPLSWTAGGREATTALIERLVTRLPAIVGAVLLLLAGWAVGRLLSWVLRRTLARGLDRLEGRGLVGGDDRFGLRRSLPGLIGGMAFWTVMAVASVAAADSLGMALLGQLMSTLARLLPQVLAGVLVAFVGVVFAELAYGAVTRTAVTAGLPYAGPLGRAVQLSIVVVAIVMGAHQAGIDSTFLMIALPVAVGVLLGGAALAFGLGARTAVANIVASHQLARLHEVGQLVRVGGQEGRIEQITPTAVVLDGEDGRVVVPARLFSEEVVVILARAQR